MAMIGFHPYKALLSLVGRSDVRHVTIAGKKAKPDASFGSRAHQLRAWFDEQIKLGVDRQALYDDYENMDVDDIISAALDLYAEDATQIDPTSGKTVWVESGNEDIATLGNQTLDRVSMEDRSTAIARGLAKYGDYFAAVLIGLDDMGRPIRVEDMAYRHPGVMYRIEDELQRLRGFVVGADIETFQEETVQEGDLSTPWDFIHYRILGRSEGETDAKYGTALIRPARRVYRYLSMMEQALTIYRIKRTPDRLKWTVDTGDAPPDEQQEILNDFIATIRKKILVDTQTGQLKQEMDPLSLDEDVFIPISGDSKTDVTVLSGSTSVGHVLDIEYMRKRLFSCLRIPPDYMGFSDAAGGLLARSPLADQDIQFARQEKRLQHAIMTGTVLLVKIDLALRGINPNSKENEFVVRMCPVSFLDELQFAEVLKVRAVIVDTLLSIGSKLKVDQDLWRTYVLKSSGFPEGVLQFVEQEARKTGNDPRVVMEVAEALQILKRTELQILMRRNALQSSAYPLKCYQKLVEAKNVDQRKVDPPKEIKS